MKNWKKLMGLALSAALSLSLLTACGGTTKPAAPSQAPAESAAAESAAPESTAPTKLVFGTSADYPPYEFHILDNGADKIVGMDVALAQAIAKDMGAELEIVDMNFENLLTLMAQGKCDFVIADMESTPDREAAADGSDPYYEDLAPMVLVKKANLDQYKTIDDFTGKNVGAQTGTNKALIVTGEDEETAPIHMTGANPVLLTNVGDLINQLVYDKCDAVVLDGAVAVKYAEANPDLAVVEGVELGHVGLPCVWVADGDPQGLLPSINETIAKLKADGSLKTFMEEADAQSSEAIGG
ncbi:MAG: transporter substrate-binding domain-containing protein [Pseudoflavonifractor sp.]|nr:transporter substrate-binding domain-containing protein [Pseudoflavonifractor sp.]